MLKYILVLITFLFEYNTLIAQDFKRTNYCQCEVKGKNLNRAINMEDIVYAVVDSLSSDHLYISFYNHTNDTVFLFKSYFDKDISTSDYLYRYDKTNKKLYSSFVPLLPYLSIKYSDRVIIQNREIEKNQVVYDFFKIPPNQVFCFNLKIKDFTKIKQAFQQFSPYSLSKFDNNVSLKKCMSIKDKANTKYILQLAYYKNIQTICDGKSYYLAELKFNEDAKSFIIIDAEIPY
ncbi:MAG: hypothetical protein EOO20_08755 [Chryseobacterium sp.]|nr:MAG: hypothetical protein EOO20_08755 [Chryseobacterium sp.]